MMKIMKEFPFLEGIYPVLCIFFIFSFVDRFLFELEKKKKKRLVVLGCNNNHDSQKLEDRFMTLSYLVRIYLSSKIIRKNNMPSKN